MGYNLIVSKHALLDIEDAIYWYESIHEGLGVKMKYSLLASLDYLVLNPLHFAKKYREIRIKFIKYFPYGIHYIVEGNDIKVIAFFHMKRDPKRWDKRAEKL